MPSVEPRVGPELTTLRSRPEFIRLSHPGAPSVFVFYHCTVAVADDHFVRGAQRTWGEQREEGEGVIVASHSSGPSRLKACSLFPTCPSGPGALCSQTSLPVVGEWTAPIPWLP